MYCVPKHLKHFHNGPGQTLANAHRPGGYRQIVGVAYVGSFPSIGKAMWQAKEIMKIYPTFSNTYFYT